MKSKSLTIAVVTVLLATACGGKQGSEQAASGNSDDGTEQNEPGDSTVYGLACDGCTDTLLVFLPRSGGDPDTFNILDAMKAHHVFGRPMIGDKVAVVLNHDNAKVADMVIDMEQLKGEWCYMVKPKLRQRVGMSQEHQQEMMQHNDSMLQKLMQPREYGMEIKSDYTARPIGITYGATPDENSPVEYPQTKSYREWRIFNGRLILNETHRDTTGVTTITNSDTAQFVLMRRDTLVLRFSNGEQQGYYRKSKDNK